MPTQGSRILLDGLSKGELNGLRGTLLGRVEANGRLLVLLDDETRSTPLKVKEENAVLQGDAAPNVDRLAVYAVASGALREAAADELTDEIASGARLEAEVAAVLVHAVAAHLRLPDVEAERVSRAGMSTVPNGEYVICNVTSRTELNGQVCTVNGGTFGRGSFARNHAQVHATGECISLPSHKLSPLSEAPAALLYDEADLAPGEPPLPPSSNLVQWLSLAEPKPFAVRVHGLTSEAGSHLNDAAGEAFRDNGNGRLGVRFAGEDAPRSLRIDNLRIARVSAPLPHSDAASGLPAHNAASRAAGSCHATAAPAPGFYVYAPPGLPRHALDWQGPGWPGVYTDRRLRGISEAPAPHVTEAATLRAALDLWDAKLASAEASCPFVVWLSVGPVAEDATAAELFDLWRWFLGTCGLGKEMASADGVGLTGTHIEAPSVLTADLAAEPMGFVGISMCSAETRHYVHDVLENLVRSPNYRLSLRGRPLRLAMLDDCCEPRHVDRRGDDELGPPAAPRKRRADDWAELVACADAPFAYEAWQCRRPPGPRGGGAMGMASTGLPAWLSGGSGQKDVPKVE